LHLVSDLFELNVKLRWQKVNAFATQRDVQTPAVTLACCIGFTSHSTCVHRQQMDESTPLGQKTGTSAP